MTGSTRACAGGASRTRPTSDAPAWTPEVAAIVERAALRFVELGARVEDVDLGFEGVEEIFRRHWFTGAANLLRNFTAQQKAMMDPGLIEVAEQGAQIGMLDLLDAVQKRAALGVRMNLFHERTICC